MKDKLAVILNQQEQNEHVTKKYITRYAKTCATFFPGATNEFFIYGFKDWHVKKNKQNILIIRKSDGILIKSKIKSTLAAQK